MRNAGRWLTWNEKPKVFEGSLLSGMKGNDTRSVPVLYVGGGPDGPVLFEPRIASVLGYELRIVGLEKIESAWVLQEWQCEILTIKDAPPGWSVPPGGHEDDTE